jgi:hypothetical protein
LQRWNVRLRYVETLSALNFSIGDHATFNSRRAHRLAKGAKINRPHFLDLPQGRHRCSAVVCELIVHGGANDEAYS